MSLPLVPLAPIILPIVKKLLFKDLLVIEYFFIPAVLSVYSGQAQETLNPDKTLATQVNSLMAEGKK